MSGPLWQRKGPSAVATADRTQKHVDSDELNPTAPLRPHQSTDPLQALRHMAKVLRDDGYAGIRARLLAYNAYRSLARGRIDPADTQRLIAV